VLVVDVVVLVVLVAVVVVVVLVVLVEGCAVPVTVTVTAGWDTVVVTVDAGWDTVVVTVVAGWVVVFVTVSVVVLQPPTISIAPSNKHTVTIQSFLNFISLCTYIKSQSLNLLNPHSHSQYSRINFIRSRY